MYKNKYERPQKVISYTYGKASLLQLFWGYVIAVHKTIKNPLR